MLGFWTKTAQQDFAAQAQSDRVIARIPTETPCVQTDCGWDEFAQSAKRFDCPVCGGRGKIMTWVEYNLVARVMWSAMLKLAYAYPSSGVELGDCMVTVQSDYVFALDLVLGQERAYLIVDDKTVRPTTKQTQIVGGVLTEYEYTCNLYSPAEF